MGESVQDEKVKEGEFPLRTSRRNQPSQHLDLIPQDPFWTSELQNSRINCQDKVFKNYSVWGLP